MKRSLYFVYTLCLIILLAACVPPTIPAGAPAAQTQADSSAFPVTLEHKYGSTTITAKPERIVTVGLTDHDALLALGIVPVGTSEWFGGYPGSIWPWAQDELDALGGAIPEAVGGESINLEKIASLQPDLILALYSGLKQEEYDLLTQIAPTVAQSADYVDYGIPWQELTLAVGKAVGQADAAQALVDEVEARFAQVQADHPEFVGASAVATMAWQGIYLYGPQDIRSRLLTALGFVLPEGIEEITGSDFGGNLSMERADLLDTDVIIWIDPQEAEGELGGPVYQALPVHTEGREVLLSSYDELAIGGATSFVCVLSLPYLLEKLTPMLVAALDGDPATAAGAPAVESSTTTAFPVTIEHKMGSTTIAAKPARVVSLGFTDQDYLLALSVVPVGIRDWFGGQPNAVWPWARPLLNGAEPEVLSRELNFEQIARLQPDLIVAIYTSLTPEEYDLLSAIAPVVTPPAGLDDYAITWQAQTRYTGQIVGQTARAEELVTQLEAKIAKARADHPEFAGAAYAFASVYGGEYYLYGERSTASRFLTALGFVMPTDILDLTENENDYLVFSAERMDLVDRPLTLWSEGPTDAGVVDLLADPLYTNLSVHTEGRDLFLGLDLYGGAFSFSSVLSLDLLVDELVPAMALPLDGDPATVPVLGEAAASATRTVTDDLERTVEVPAHPQRIVALQDLQVLRPLLDLGLEPIASTTHPAYEGAFRFVEEYDVSSIETIGLLGEPNLEQLVLLKPDLIIGTLSAGTDTQLEQISVIAPTLVYNAGRPVIEYHRSLAAAVGAVDAFDALMADYEVRLAALQQELAPISADLTVSLLAFNPNAGQIEIGEGPYTLVFRGAGINQPDPQVNFEGADEGVRRYWISPELLPAHDADLILLLYTRDPAVNAPITDSAIWATLKAVQAGQVVEINGSTWYVQSVRSLFSVIEAMEQHLVEAAVDTRVFE